MCSTKSFREMPYFWNKKNQIVFFSFFISSYFGFVAVECQQKTTYLSFLIPQKYGKFWSISLKLFVEHKLWNCEEWICTLPASHDHVQQIWNLVNANMKKMKNNIKETIKGRFQSGNLCTGISSISRAFRSDPRSTGTNPIERINPLTSSLAEWTSPEYKTSLLPWKIEK